MLMLREKRRLRIEGAQFTLPLVSPFLAPGVIFMKRTCREAAIPTWRERQLAMTELLRRARIVTDPEKLAHLNAKAAQRKARVAHEALRTAETPVQWIVSGH